MALNIGAINLHIDVKRSESTRRLIIRWETANKVVGGELDLTDLFLSIMEFWQVGEHKTHECLIYCDEHQIWFRSGTNCPLDIIHTCTSEICPHKPMEVKLAKNDA